MIGIESLCTPVTASSVCLLEMKMSETNFSGEVDLVSFLDLVPPVRLTFVLLYRGTVVKHVP